MTSSKTLISCHHTKVLFQGKTAFTNLDFSGKSGQHWAIIAKSNWRQTAFLELMLGNAVVVDGTLTRDFAFNYFDKRKFSKLAHSSRDLIAYVSQRYEFRNKSNLQNFYFQQRFNSSEADDTNSVREYLSAVDSKITGPWTYEKVIELLNLTHLQDESLLKLSNGETRRLALATGLLRQPKIFLMDHPTTGLDVKSRKDFGNVLKAIIQSGIHVILTCNPKEVPAGVTHFAELDETGVRSCGPVDEMDIQSFGISRQSFDWEKLNALLPKNFEIGKELIHLEGVTIHYDEKDILSDVSWQVFSGQHWQLKGSNGSGKSTLISLLIGENPQAYSQNIWLFGRRRGTGESIWDIKKPIGFVAPALSRFFPRNQTCRKVILSGLFDTMGLFKKVTKEQEDLAEHWLKLFDLAEVGEVPIQRLALHQQRWTLLARALIKGPKLLILDEASQGLDDEQRSLFKTVIQKICEGSGMTLIYVSHYTSDVPEAVDQVFDLSD